MISSRERPGIRRWNRLGHGRAPTLSACADARFDCAGAVTGIDGPARPRLPTVPLRVTYPVGRKKVNCCRDTLVATVHTAYSDRQFESNVADLLSARSKNPVESAPSIP